MYNVSQLTHEKYGSVVVIEKVLNGYFLTPFNAVQAAINEQKLFSISVSEKVRLLIDDQIMTPHQAQHWAKEEYEELPKCKACGKPLPEDLVMHQLTPHFFCSQNFADKDYKLQLEKMQDEEEIEFD